MTKILTIAIPTYNRAELLDKQLTWLSQAIKGFESECEILVSDNCSTDHTQSIIKKWQNILSDITFKSNKNPENIGVMRNIIYCLSYSTTKYVWTIGDDDPIQERAVAYVMSKIKNIEDLSLLFLNFSGRNKITGEAVHPPKIVGNRWFDADSEDGEGDGKAIFEHCFAKSVGAVIFLTATVYRTDLVKRALQIWPTASNNWISLAYLAGYCAANGKVIVTKETYLECVVGVSYWQKEPKSALLMQYQHIPEVILKLEEVGYSKAYCCRMLLQNYHEVDLKVFLGAIRRWPVSAIKTVVPFLALASLAAFELMPIRELKVKKVAEISTQQIRNNES
ncbi:glycosyltransferase family 2 protein [Anabaena catenula]|uniref:Glycosyltransferase family 2 protein n=1 Tax=Anabaena catenula FACHB-362 TaxID=2692877 RepID=A0ABR8J2B2_9NOST|nr:glycosyltransferase family 2 protein [Anabaena catenula]MBD2691798.1 glycosyltransferase family 2 protein [Anabaena catenula FACHB-362]